MTIRLKAGEEQSRSLQQYSSLVRIVNKAFGGGSPEPAVDEALIPQTAEEAVQRFRALFN